MAAKPGELDFQALAKEALTAGDSVSTEKKVKIAASEGGVPPPSQEQVDSNNTEPEFQEVEVEDTQTENVESVENQSEEENTTVENGEVPKSSETKKPQKLNDDDMVEVVVDGEPEVITYKDYKDRVRKEATITKRFQNFAQTRDEFNQQVANIVSQLEAREAALAQQAQPKVDPVQQALIDLLQGKKPAPEKSPDEILTVAEMQAAQAKLREEFENSRRKDREDFDNSLQRARQAALEEAKLNKERQQFFNGIDQLVAKDAYKNLNDVIPHIKAHILSHVQSVQPQSLEEALEASESWLKDRSDKLKKLSVAKEQKQQKEAVRQKMESNNGSPTTLAKGQQTNADKAKKFVMKNGKPDWEAMKKDAQARWNSMAG